MDGKDRHDMSVLKSGERLRFRAFPRRYFEHDGPAGQVCLPSEKDTRERPTAQFVRQAKAKNLVVDGQSFDSIEGMRAGNHRRWAYAWADIFCRRQVGAVVY